MSIEELKQSDLASLIKASTSIEQALKKGDVVVYESTVYPSATEEACIPVLEQVSGLKFNQDFFAGYSLERINPGDKLYRVTNILKMTSGSNPEVTDFVEAVYQFIVSAGTHKVASIKVAEAAKFIENTQRVVNIVLQLIKEMVKQRIQVVGSKILVMGLSFKENCPDIRNTKIVDMVKALKEYDLDLDIYDPWVDPLDTAKEYGIDPVAGLANDKYDAIVLAVAHDQFKQMTAAEINALGKVKHVLFDLKYILDINEANLRL